MNAAFTLIQICELTGLDELTVTRYVEREWLRPVTRSEWDQEDLARIRFIVELQQDFGANEEAIPIILHLVDQIHYFRGRMQDLAK
ncbi:MAG: hypothetical protein H7333_02000 [Bdellovibrionales bacterium]|nr:hypothetical protein [Oligoflexia bacterium]